MSEKINDSNAEKVSAGYEAPDAQIASEIGPGTIILQTVVDITANPTVNPTTMPTVMPTVAPTIMPVVAPTLLTSTLTPPGSVSPNSTENK